MSSLHELANRFLSRMQVSAYEAREKLQQKLGWTDLQVASDPVKREVLNEPRRRAFLMAKSVARYRRSKRPCRP